MRRKKELIKTIQKELSLDSYREAEEVFNGVSKGLEKRLEEDGEVKIPGIGIIKVVEKGGRSVKVPTKNDEIYVPKRKGLSIKEDRKFRSKAH